MTTAAPMSTVARPTTKPLVLAHLTVDHSVQRTLKASLVERYSNPFLPEAFGVPVVSLRGDGTLHIIDGQHRVAAARAAGHGDMVADCLVYENLTRAQEAAMFRLLNDRGAVNPLEKFLVRIVEGDQAANTLANMLEKHGWTIRVGKQDGSFAAVGTLEKVAAGAGIVKDGGHWQIADLCIAMVTAAWGHKPEAVRGELLHGLGMVLLRYAGQVDVPKLLDGMAEHEGGPRALLGRGRGLADLRGGRVTDGIADVLVNLHNKKKRGESRLPDWRAA